MKSGINGNGRDEIFSSQIRVPEAIMRILAFTTEIHCISHFCYHPLSTTSEAEVK